MSSSETVDRGNETLRKLSGGLVVGTVWGLLSSFTNAHAMPIGVAASLLVNAGWAWAAVPVVAGWLARTPKAGAVAGAVGLIATTTSYYVVDSVLRNEAFSMYWPEMRMWWIASIVFGSGLGAVGSAIPRAGIIGLLAGLVIPLGAIVEMIWLPRDPVGVVARSAELEWIRRITCVVAAAAAIAVLVRYVKGVWQHRTTPE